MRAYAEMYGISPICLALANVYGPRQNPHGEAGVITVFGRAMLTDDFATVYGDGTAARDYVYVDDVVDAFVRAADGSAQHGRHLQHRHGSTGHRDRSPPADRRVLGSSSAPCFAAARSGELQAIALDATKAQTGTRLGTFRRSGRRDRTHDPVAARRSGLGSPAISFRVKHLSKQHEGVEQVRCRLCNSIRLVSVLDLGATPPCEKFLTVDELDVPEPTYPLHLRLCEDCLLLQIPALITPEETFTEYAYFSSYSDSFVAHAKTFVDQAADRLELDRESFVVEVASNDGYLLQHAVGQGYPMSGH